MSVASSISRRAAIVASGRMDTSIRPVAVVGVVVGRASVGAVAVSVGVGVPPGSSVPVLSSVVSTPSGSSVVVSWSTDVGADSHASLILAPARGCSWSWQLSGTLDTTPGSQVFDFDAFNEPASTVTSFRSAGVYTIGYMQGGGWEDFRPDSAAFPESVKGAPIQGFVTEKWLDISAVAILQPIMEARADVVASKGFDGVEWDCVSNYSEVSGFTLTAAQQITYNRMLARISHVRGLAAFLKNDAGQVVALQPHFEGVIIEEAFRYNESASYAAFGNNSKASLHCEYRLADVNCTLSTSLNWSSIYSYLALDRKFISTCVTSPPAAVALGAKTPPVTVTGFRTSHSVTFTGLTAGQRYSTVVWSTNPAGKAYSTVMWFVAGGSAVTGSTEFSGG